MGLDTSSESWTSEGLNQHPQWARFKAHKVMGISFTHYLLDTLQVYGEIDNVWTVHTRYDSADNLRNIRIALGVKYIF